MPRIPYPDPEKLTPIQRKTIETPLNIARMTAYMPDKLLTTMGAFGYEVLKNEHLDELLREMVIVRVGYLSNSAYELHQHIQLSRKLGMPEEKLAALEHGAEAPCFDAKEKALLRFVDELVRDVRPGDATLDEARRLLTMDELFSVLATVGAYMMVCRILETTGPELDDDGVIIDPAGG